jgi:hypothetical protein
MRELGRKVGSLKNDGALVLGALDFLLSGV